MKKLLPSGKPVSVKSLKAICVFFILTLLVSNNLKAQSWHNNSWTFRKAITIDYTKVGTGPHTNFPVLISHTDAALISGAQADGDDILFTSSDGTTKLNHQIDLYTSATGNLVAWVNVPSISSSANTTIYMYYGNPTCGTQQNIGATWNSNFKNVYHLTNDPYTAVSGGTSGSTAGSPSLSTTAKIAKSYYFNQADGTDYVTIASQQSKPSTVTLSAWVYCTATDANGEIMNISDNVGIRMNSSRLYGTYYTGSTWVDLNANANYMNGWHYVVYTVQAGSQKLYIDGSLAASGTTANAPSYGASGNTVVANHAALSANWRYSGYIDEVRVAGDVKSAGWVQTEYNNQNSPSTFYSVASAIGQNIFTGTGNFSDAAKWSRGTVPIAGDKLIMNGICTINNNGTYDNVVYGDLVINSGCTIKWPASGTNRLNVNNLTAGSATSTIDMTYGGKLIIRGAPSGYPNFTPGSGTVELQNTNSVTLTDAYMSFNNLTINGTGSIVPTTGIDLSINGNLTISAGSLNFTGMPNSLWVSGNFTNNVATTGYRQGTGTTYFSGSGDQTIGGTATTAFYNLYIGGSSTKTLAANIAVTTDLNVAAATFDLGVYTANRATGGGALTVASGATLKIGGSNGIPSNYSTHSINASSSIEFSGTTQTIGLLNSSQNYGNLTVSGSGTKSLSANLGVAGNLAVNIGTLDLGSYTANRLTAGGTITVGNNATLKIGGTNTFPSNYAAYSFSYPTSTVEYAGSNQTISSLGGNWYVILAISGTGTKTLAATTWCYDITLTASTISTGSYILYSNDPATARTSGYIIGNFQKKLNYPPANTTFEVGDVNGYTPLSIYANSINDTCSVIVRTDAGDHANIGYSTINSFKSVNRTWTITKGSPLDRLTSYDPTVTFLSSDVDAGAATASFVMGRYNSGWTYPAIGTRTAITTTASSITALGVLAVGEPCVSPTTANAGPDQTGSATCGLTTITLSGNTPTVGTGTWSIISGAGGTITTASSATSTFTGTAGSTYTLRWTITNGSCGSSTDDVVITFNRNPTTANAGPDQTSAATCGLTSITLAGNTATAGTGAWSIVSGTGGTVTTASSPTSTFSGVAGSTYTLRWTISNTPCTASTDDVVITFNRNPTAANAGPDQTGAATCGSTSVTVAANTPTIGIGAWSIVSGTGGSFYLPSIPTTSFIGVAGNTYTLRWTISNGACTSSTDDVTVTFNQNPTTANAGTDQTGAATCGLTTALLSGNTPTVGTASWSLISGTGGTYLNSPSPRITGIAGNSYTLRYTISNGACTASTDDMTVTFNQNPTTANAGPDQSVCGTYAVLASNTASVGTGTWTVVSGTGGIIGNPSIPSTSFIGVAGNTYTLRWTIANAPCTASYDDVLVTFYASPTTSSAGPDQTGLSTCGLTSVTLAANTPTVGTGAWSIVSGAAGTITTPSSPTSTFSGAAGNTYTLRWTISNGVCTASTDDVVITFNRNPTTANAGPDQNICGTSTALAGNSPTSGYGTWNVISGSGGLFSFDDVYNSSFTGVAGNTYTLRWTIASGPCTVSTDDVVISFYANPGAVNAGPDQTGSATCGQTSVTLSASSQTPGTGIWSIVSGTGGTVTSPSNKTSTFSGVAGNTYTLRWTNSNGTCTAVTDDMVITFNQNPTTANAGADQTGAATCGTTSVTLAGNTATIGTGAWSIVSGTGGTITTPSSATSTFTGIAGNTYTLRWTISNSPCTASIDDVVITFNQNPTTANAGPDQTGTATCGLTSVTLAGNTATVGTGAWSIVSGSGGTVTTPSSATSTFSGTAGTTYTLRWTISNAPCTASTDDVVITFNRNPTTANAGADQSGATTCGLTSVTLAGNTATVGTGAWSIVSGLGGSITTPSSATSTFTGVAGSTYTLRWTISSSPCTASTDDVVITFNQNPTVSGIATVTCVGGSTGNITATGNGGTAPYTYSIDGITYQTSTLFSGLASGSYTLYVKSNSGCIASTIVTVSSYATSADDQFAAGTNSWIGHVYDGTAFNNYIGHYTEPETFTQGFGSAASCFDVVSGATTPSIYTETFSVRYRMNSTRQGLYTVDLGSDDGNRLTVDGTALFNFWNDHGNTWKTGVLVNLTGTSSLVYDFYENAGANVVAFVNFNLILANTLSVNTSQTICTGNTASAISGDIYGTLPAGITLSGTGYQWSYSATPGGARTVIAGATGATFAPSAAAAPFNTPGTYYIYRNAALSSSNNLDPNPYVATNESNAATLIVTLLSAATISYASSSYCSTAGTATVSQTGTAGGTYSSTAGLTINSSTGAITLGSSTAGTYTVTYTMINSGCTTTATTSVTVTAIPTTSNAGPNQTGTATCGLTTVTLAANTAAVGIGSWSIVSGAGGTITTPSSATSTFSGTAGTTYTLRWTISNAPCVASTDDVVITFNQNPTTANAGSDQTGATTCGTTGVTLAGNTAAVGTGAWSIISGSGGTITTPSSATSTFTGVGGSTYTLRWTISNAPCTASTDDMVITFNRNPTTANAGPDQTGMATCGLTSVTLAGNAAAIGTGVWNIVSGTGGTITTPSSSTSTFSGIAGNSYTLRWTISNSPCTTSTDDVTITFNASAGSATISYTGTPYCTNNGTATVTRTGTAGGTYSSTAGLSINSASGAINLAGSTAGTYTVTYTLTNGVCSFTATTEVTITAAPAANISYSGSPYCTSAGIVGVTLTGTPGGTYSSTAGLNIDAPTGEVTLTNSTPGTYTVTYTVASAGGCAVFQATASITVSSLNTWTGAVNTDWNNTGNWACGSVPSSALDALIPTGLTNYPTISSTGSVNNLNLESNTALTVNGTLKISGAFNNAGTINSASGTVEFNGTGDQSISANTFVNNTLLNLKISNNLSLLGTQIVTGTVSFNGSAKTLTTNDYLVLKSTASGTARVADITNGGVYTSNAIVGKVTMERYVPARRAWRLLSVPMSSAGAPTINAAWQEGVTSGNPHPGYGIQITGGPATNGFDQGVNYNPSLKAYADGGGVYGVTNTNIPITNYPGYFVFIRGNRSTNLMAGTAAPLSNTTLRIKGNINTGNVQQTIAANGVNLASNPYPSAIDFHKLTKLNVNDKLWVWDPKMAGSSGFGAYVSLIWNGFDYDATSSVSPIGQYIPSGEAFLVETANGSTSGTLTFKEADKTASGNDQLFRPAASPASLRVDLYSVDGSGNTALIDGILTTYNDVYSSNVDGNDARKVSNTGENVSITRDGTLLSIERRYSVTKDDTTFLNMTALKKQKYQLHINIAHMTDNGVVAYLKDKYASVTDNMLLSMDGITDVPFTVNTDAGSYAANRFSVVFKKMQILPVKFVAVNATNKQDYIAIEWKTENAYNVKTYDVEISSTGAGFRKAATVNAAATTSAAYTWNDSNMFSGTHYYRIKSTDTDGQTMYSEIVKVVVGNIAGEIVVHPNIISGGIINLQFKNMPGGQYKATLLDVAGSELFVETIKHSGGSLLKKLILAKEMVKGIYYLEVIKPGGARTNIRLLNE